MNSLLIATQNAGKLREFQALLRPRFQCVSVDATAPAVLEDGKTYQENAFKKAKAFFEHYHQPVLSDDSGLEVDALSGAPGIHSARFGGEAISWPERWKLLHEKLANFPEKDWAARFRCVLCYFEGQVPLYFEGLAEGLIVRTPKGGKGFGYDPIFYSTELKKTFAEASEAEKDRASHRGLAVKAFLKGFKLDRR